MYESRNLFLCSRLGLSTFRYFEVFLCEGKLENVDRRSGFIKAFKRMQCPFSAVANGLWTDWVNTLQNIFILNIPSLHQPF